MASQHTADVGELSTLLSADDPVLLEYFAKKGVKWTTVGTGEKASEADDDRYLVMYAGAKPINLATAKVTVPGDIEDPHAREVAQKVLKVSFVANMAARDAPGAFKAMVGLLWYDQLIRMGLETLGIAIEECPEMYALRSVTTTGRV